MKLTYFIYLQLTICWLIKHFTVIYADANKQFLTLNLNIFCHQKISLSGTPISLPKIADLPIWAQEKITCMVDSEDADQTWQMPRLIWVFVGHTGHFIMRWLISYHWPHCCIQASLNPSYCHMWQSKSSACKRPSGFPTRSSILTDFVQNEWNNRDGLQNPIKEVIIYSVFASRGMCTTESKIWQKLIGLFFLMVMGWRSMSSLIPVYTIHWPILHFLC